MWTKKLVHFDFAEKLLEQKHGLIPEGEFWVGYDDLDGDGVWTSALEGGGVSGAGGASPSSNQTGLHVRMNNVTQHHCAALRMGTGGYEPSFVIFFCYATKINLPITNNFVFYSCPIKGSTSIPRILHAWVRFHFGLLHT